MEDDYYSILGLSKGAKESEIKKAYYKLARENHPDKSSEDQREEATKNFQKIGEAYEVLSDPEKRSIYDVAGKEGLSGGGGMNTNFDPFEMFSGMFGRSQNFSQGQREHQRTKNKETVFPLKVSLTEVYTGKKKKLKITKKVIVNKNDKNTQIVENIEKTWKKCNECRGQGVVMEMRQLGPGFMTQTQRECNFCSAKGYTFSEEYELTEMSEIIEVEIPKGAQNNYQIRFPNQGNVIPGTYPGDLIVVFQVNNNENGYTRNQQGRNNNELIYEKKILLCEALCGSSFSLTSLDNRSLFITFSSVIIPGERKIIPREGILDANLIIIFDIVFPTSFPKEKRKEIRKLLPTPINKAIKSKEDICYDI